MTRMDVFVCTFCFALFCFALIFHLPSFILFFFFVNRYGRVCMYILFCFVLIFHLFFFIVNRLAVSTKTTSKVAAVFLVCVCILEVCAHAKCFYFLLMLYIRNVSLFSLSRRCICETFFSLNLVYMKRCFFFSLSLDVVYTKLFFLELCIHETFFIFSRYCIYETFSSPSKYVYTKRFFPLSRVFFFLMFGEENDILSGKCI